MKAREWGGRGFEAKVEKAGRVLDSLSLFLSPVRDLGWGQVQIGCQF